jgi:glycosyltransferase involved in cell wall biosynthesis
VVTLLDLIWLSFPESMDPWSTWAMKATAPPSARAVDRVLAISEAAADDLADRLRLPRAKIDVTPLGIRRGALADPAPEADVRRSLELGGAPVVLCVAQKRSHKNIAGLVRALPLLADTQAVLVVPGESTPHEDELKALASELGVEARVRFPGWLSDAELEALYGLATAFVLPSFEEGFGLPVLEAMRRGTPVACSDASSLPEVAGDAALLFDPHDPAAIARQVDRLLADSELRERLRERGLRRCDEFTWERTARATLAAYRRAIAGRRERRAA